MAKVTVFHGTTLERSEKILSDKVLKMTSSENARYNNTTNGYIYVTKRLCDALDFSTRPNTNEDTLTFVVFKILIEDRELLPDTDEKKWISTLSGGGEKHCFRINRDLNIGEDVISIFCRKMKSAKDIGNYMQAIQYAEKEIKESEWQSLCQD